MSDRIGAASLQFEDLWLSAGQSPSAEPRKICLCDKSVAPDLTGTRRREQNWNMERAPLILRQVSPQIYRVWHGDKCIGSILEEKHGQSHYWTWSVAGVHSDPPGAIRGRGRTETKGEALASFRATFDAILAGPHHWVPEPAKWTPGGGKWLG